MQAAEECDDGNTTSGDGCSATCTAETPWEIETNDTIATATPLWGGTSAFHAAISPLGDIDHFSFTLPAGKNPVLTTHDINNALACAGDTEITLFDSVGIAIATDDDGGTDACSMINSTLYPDVNNLPAGTYYIRVNEYMSNDAIASYQLDVAFE
jgi:cysteine-rich repeat protein